MTRTVSTADTEVYNMFSQGWEEPHKPLTNHLMQQLTVALPKEHTQIQKFGNVKQEVLIDNFSKHSWSDEVLLRKHK